MSAISRRLSRLTVEPVRINEAVFQQAYGRGGWHHSFEAPTPAQLFDLAVLYDFMNVNQDHTLALFNAPASRQAQVILLVTYCLPASGIVISSRAFFYIDNEQERHMKAGWQWGWSTFLLGSFFVTLSAADAGVTLIGTGDERWLQN